MRSAQTFLLHVLGTVSYTTFALPTMSSTQVLPHYTLLTALDATASTSAVTDTQSHATLDIGASCGTADAAATVGHAHLLALCTTRATLSLTSTTSTVADAQSSGHRVASTP